VLFGSVQDNVSTFNISLRSITLSEIDQTRMLGAEDVSPKARRFRLSLTIHGPEPAAVLITHEVNRELLPSDLVGLKLGGLLSLPIDRALALDDLSKMGH